MVIELKNKDAVIEYINLAGIGFITDTEYKKREIYDLKLMPKFPHKAHKLSLKIRIIDVEKYDNGSFFYRAVYRNLSNAKLCILKKVLKEIECRRT